MTNGEIIERGRHEDLINNNSYYSLLVENEKKAG
jgi:ABC-type multidrug transport system fused ATPase/permease subunit